jgi:pyruvate formate-lyase activating enzyme-like uncharacterized protein
MVLEKCIGELPEGCKLCRQGAKMVLLLTGVCGRGCYYCPLSLEKQGKDVVFVNEGRIDDPHLEAKKVIDEATAMKALGTGITGGDPMIKPGRAIDYIQLLKEHFGDEHHIHLYTGGRFEPRYIKVLAQAGLNEIRFHPPTNIWSKLPGTDLAKIINLALDTDMDVGVEVPAIPTAEAKADTIEMIKFLDGQGVLFVNLNELEYSEANFESLNKLGFSIKDDVSSAVKGSEEAALEIMDTADYDLTVHYCSSSFKDRVQLRKRIQRRASVVRKPYEVLTDDDTFVLGVIESKANLMLTREELMVEYDRPDELIHVNIDKKRIELAPWILEEIAGNIEFLCFMVEEYPTIDRLEVERTPLN